MKFYKEKENSNYYWHKNFYTNISYIYQAYSYIKFFKNGKEHNDKNASYYSLTSNFKSYYLNNKAYGFSNDFNKQSWRKFVRAFKLQAFL